MMESIWNRLHIIKMESIINRLQIFKMDLFVIAITDN